MRVVCALISKGNKYLVAQRPAHKSHPLLWEFPGGKVEPGETDQTAICREIREELGIEVRTVRQLAAITYSDPDKSIELVAWECEWTGGEMHLQEHSDSRWAALNELHKTEMCPADVVLVAALKKGSAIHNKPN